MADNVTIVPSYMKYNTREVERILEQVENTTEASEESVRNIVKDYMRGSGQEQEPSDE